ncbi:hypothetical protein E4U19_006640, partial [Claviceps sp. Clav32 group G5]
PIETIWGFVEWIENPNMTEELFEPAILVRFMNPVIDEDCKENIDLCNTCRNPFEDIDMLSFIIVRSFVKCIARSVWVTESMGCPTVCPVNPSLDEVLRAKLMEQFDRVIGELRYGRLTIE